MENNRDDILNELIKYYDGDSEKQGEDTVKLSPKADTANDMEETIVIKRQQALPEREEKLGETITVNVKPKEEPAPEEKEKKSDITGTQRIATPKRRPRPVEEEVFGNLDINGRPIEVTRPEPEDEPIYQEEQHGAGGAEPANHEPVRRARRPDSAAKVRMTEPDEEDEPERYKRRSGIWYAAKPLWVTLIICAVFAAAFKFHVTNTGFIGIYKHNFNNNMRYIFNMFGVEWDPEGSIGTVTKSESGPRLLAEGDEEKITVSGYTEKDNVEESVPSEYETVGEDRSVIPFADADNSDFSEYRGGIVCASSDEICYINQKGKTEWSDDISIANPIVSARGNYIAVGSKGGTQLRLYRKNKLIYSVDVPDKVRSLVVSEKGDTVLITEKTSYKGAVALVNKKGELVFSWSSGTNYITAASVLNNRKIAVALSSTDTSVTSFVMMFDIKSTEPASGAELKDTLIYSLATDGKNIMANGDNCAALITADSEVRYDNRFNDVNITHSANDRHGYRVITYTSDNIPMMTVYDKKGKTVEDTDIEATPDFVAINMTTVLYNNGRDVICGRVDDDKKTLYAAPREIKKLLILDTGAYAIIYEDGFEIIRL